MTEAKENLKDDSPITEKEMVGLVYKSKVKDLLVENGKKIRIKGDAKDKFYEYFDLVVKQGANSLLKNMPRKIKGDNKGELKVLTITIEILDSLINNIKKSEDSKNCKIDEF